MGNLYFYIDYITKKTVSDMERITSLKHCPLEILPMEPIFLEVKK